jgi:hypothetical protein
LALRLHVRAHRVGYHGIHNITLQTIRAPGLYTVPLSFSNPFVVEVLPKAVRLGTTGAIGGRTQMIAPSARVGRRKGDGAELREIREHAPGDPYRRIAWKPSARRGKLLIIENEQEQSDVVWLVVDASVDAASGLIGQAALDFAIDEATSIMDAHLTRGDQVGLAVVGTRVLSKVLPGRGPRHAAKILAALSLETHTADADRSDWDDGDVARRVLEHAASIDGEAAQLKSYEHEKLALLAARLLRHAPVTAEAPWAHSSTGRTLRKYLLSFGIHPPPRGTSDRHHCEREIAKALRDITSTRRPPTLVYLFGRPPTFETPRQLLDVLARIPKHRTEVRFVPALESSELDDSAAKNKLRSESQSLMVQDALRHRQRIASEDGIQQLSRIGVRLARPRRFYPKKRPDDAA